MWRVSTPPCKMKSSMRRPTSLSAKAVTTAVRRPKQRRRPRATLYSPPPSHAVKERAVRTRMSPGSRRSMTSPSEIWSKRQLDLGLTFNMGNLRGGVDAGYSPLHRFTDFSDHPHGLRGQAGDFLPVPVGDQLRRDHPAAAHGQHGGNLQVGRQLRE